MASFNWHKSHRMDDVSYHGSPDYECDFCHVSERDPRISDPCEKAAECLAREAAAEEARERAEYAKLLAERKRFEHLHDKYGEK